MRSDATDEALVRDGYEVFFEVFIADDPWIYIDYDNWRWKHLDNPDRLETIGVVSYVDDRPVCAQFYLGTRIQYGGREYVCAQAADTAATSVGRGANFLKLFMSGDRILRDEGVPFRFGTPNDNSFPVVSRLRDKLVGSFVHELIDLDGRFATLEARSRMLGGGCCVELSETCPFEESDYARMNARTDQIRAVKSAAYYQRHMGDYPHGRFTYVRAFSPAGLLGYFVVRHERPGAGLVVDWDVFPQGDASAEDAVSTLLAASSEVFSHLEVWAVNTANGDSDVLEACGFERLRDGEGADVEDRFCVTPMNDDLGGAIYDFSKWRLTESDIDSYYHSMQRL